MSTAVITTLVPAPTATPRGAIAVGLIANFVLDLMVWNRARIQRKRLQREIMNLRIYANAIRHSEPSLSSDLFAAADRAS